MEFLTQYIAPVTLGICLCVGYIIKHFFHSASVNRFIPLIVGILGITITCFVEWPVNEPQQIPEVVLRGLVSGLSSTGFYEMFKNFIEKGKLDAEDGGDIYEEP